MFHALSDNDPLVAIADGLSSNHVREWIPDGDQGTADTIARMQKLISRGKRDFKVREEVGKILNGDYPDIPACSNKNQLCYAQAIYQFCKTKIKYAFDPSLVEYIEDARLILKSRIADCDSICVVGCSMDESIGQNCQLVTIKADQQRPSEYSHVYYRVQVPGVGWVDCDPTMPNQQFGWSAPTYFDIKYWPASTDDVGAPVDTTPSVTLDELAAAMSSSAQKYSNQLTGLGSLHMTRLGCGADCGCGKPAMAGLGRLGANSREVTVAGLLNGDVLAQIQQMQADYQANAHSLDTSQAQIASMAPGLEKTQAQALQAAGENSLRAQFVAYRTLRDDYNNFVTQARAYTGGLYNPGLAGLGVLGVDDSVIASILVVGALALLADKIATGIAAANGKDIETKGYIEQLADLGKGTGSLIESTGNTAIKLAVVGGVGFLTYLFLKSRGILKHA